MLCETLILFGVLIFALHKYLSRNFDYWAIRGVPYIKPMPFVGGMASRVFLRKSFFDFDKDNYDYFKDSPYGGYYEGPNPVLYIRDVELLRLIFIKDFDHFVDRREFSFGDELFTKMVSNMRGQEWKDVRSTITPAFTSGKMKHIFENVHNCSDNCVKYLRGYAQSGKSLDMKDCFGRYTMDVVATSAFGVQCNCFDNPDAEFPKMAARVMNLNPIRAVLISIMFIMPKLAEKLNLPLFDLKASHFFKEVVQNTIKYREKEGTKGKDFLQLLMDAQKGELEEDTEIDTTIDHGLSNNVKGRAKHILTDTVVLANSVLFFVVGYETTASMLSFAVYELACNPKIQEKLHEEVKNVLKRHEGKVTYEGLQEMEYLDMVINETQRLHPGATRLERMCSKDYKVPNSNLVIEKDIVVCVSIPGIHMDKKYYPNPEKFDPERFNPENKSKISPYAFIPFGIGPRNCVGMRFALMEAKVVLANLAMQLKFNTCEKTQIPVSYDKTAMMLRGEKGIWLSIEERK